MQKEAQDDKEQIEQLKKQVRIAEAQKNVCSACGLKIETAAHQTANEIVRRIEKLKQIMKT